MVNGKGLDIQPDFGQAFIFNFCHNNLDYLCICQYRRDHFNLCQSYLLIKCYVFNDQLIKIIITIIILSINTCCPGQQSPYF